MFGIPQFIYNYGAWMLGYAAEPPAVANHDLPHQMESGVHTPVSLDLEPEAPPLNFDTQLGRRLDSKLPAFHAKAHQLNAKMEPLLAQTRSPDFVSQNCLQAEQLFIEFYRLYCGYSDYLKSSPIEQEFLSLPTTPSSNSDRVYALLHINTISLCLKGMELLTNEFCLSDAILRGVCMNYLSADARSVPFSPLSQELSTVSLDTFVHSKLALLQLGFKLIEKYQDKIGFDQLCQSYAQFVVNTGILVERAEKETAIPIESSLEETRAALGQFVYAEQILHHRLCFAYSEEHRAHKNCVYLIHHLRFCKFLVRPSSMVPILHCLNQLEGTPSAIQVQQIASYLEFFLARSLPDHIPVDAIVIKPHIEAFVFMMTNQDSWLNKALAKDELSQLTSTVKTKFSQAEQIAQRHFSITLSKLPKSTLATFNYDAEPAENTPPKDVHPKNLRKRDIDCLHQALSIPAVGLSSVPKSKVSVQKQSATALHSLFETANKQSTQFITHYQSKSKEQFPNAHLRAAQTTISAYQTYLSTHPCEAQILVRPFVPVVMCNARNNHGNVGKTSQKTRHFALQQLCLFVNHYQYQTNRQLESLDNQFLQIKKMKPSNERERQFQQLCASMERFQNERLECITHTIKATVAHQDREHEFMSKSEILIDVVVDMSTLWEKMLTIHLETQAISGISKATLTNLQATILDGPFYKNRGLLSVVLLHSSLPVTPYFRQKVNCIKLIISKDEIIEALTQLDYFSIELQVDPELLQLLFQQLTHAVNAEVKQLKANPSGSSPVTLAVMNSFEHGWLQRHWHEFVYLRNGMIPDEQNLLPLIKTHHDAVKQQVINAKAKRQRLYEVGQRVLARKAKPAPPPNQGKAARPLKPQPQKMQLEPTTGALEPVTESEIDKVFTKVEAMIPTQPASAMLELNKIFEASQDRPNFRVRAQINIAFAAVMEVTTTLNKFSQVAKDSAVFQKMLNTAIDSPPHHFQSKDLYKKMILHYENLATLCEQLDASINTFKARMIDFNKIAPQVSSEDETVHDIVCSVLMDCSNRLIQVESTLEVLQDCVRLRHLHNTALAQVKKKENVDYDSRYKAKMAFQHGGNSVMASQAVVMKAIGTLVDAQVRAFEGETRQ
ncbi:hypothetical protein [Parashewanella tropica]|uniref:hypothetical protein n=1 Tax=Parashewanella tropica TaxID=2547970 RepID=UPI00105AAE5C|nr:hypothetical protein [Parashewanella tropica]